MSGTVSKVHKTARRRYVLFHLHRTGPSIDARHVSNAIWKSFLSLFGETSVADSRLFINDYDEENGLGVLQCNAESVDKVLASAALLSSIDGTQVSFWPERTSGTLKGLKR